MPTYEYACKSCGEHLEVVQSFKDEALTECPHCGGNLKKVFGSIGIAFKGSGFYRNDSREGKSSVKPAAVGAGSESTTAASGGEASKPASSDGAGADKPAASTTPKDSPATTSPAKSPSSAAAAS